MKKAMRSLVALALAMGVAGCSTSTTMVLNNRLEMTRTGDCSDDDVATIVVDPGEALAIEHDVRKGTMRLRVRNLGEDAFFDDLSNYDGTIYLTDVEGACNVSAYGADTDASVTVYACDASEAHGR